MDRNDHDQIEREARQLRVRELRWLLGEALEGIARVLMLRPSAPQPPDPVTERFMGLGLASFQERLKNSRPPRIAFIRATNRSKCSGTSTKFRRSLFTMRSGLSE
jgi:hypothetical protein